MIKSAFLFISYLCNFRCPFCYIWRRNPTDLLLQQLDYKQWMSVMDKLSTYGVKKIDILGGEPTIYTHISDIVTYALDKFEHVTIQSNGVLINYNLINDITNKYNGIPRNLSFVISVESADKEYHNRIRHPDTWSKIMKNVIEYKNMGFDVAIRSNIFADNNITDLADWCGKHGIKFIATRYLSVNGKKDALAPDQDRLFKVYEDMVELNKKYGDLIILNEGLFFLIQPDLVKKYKNFFIKYGNTCQALRAQRIAISPNGSIYPCFMFLDDKKHYIGNINDDMNKIESKLESWASKIKKYKWMDSCKNCPLKDVCGGGCAYYHVNLKKKGDPYCIAPLLYSKR